MYRKMCTTQGGKEGGWGGGGGERGRKGGVGGWEGEKRGGMGGKGGMKLGVCAFFMDKLGDMSVDLHFPAAPGRSTPSFQRHGRH